MDSVLRKIKWNNFYISFISGLMGVYCIVNVYVVESWMVHDHWMIDVESHLVVPIIGIGGEVFFPMVCMLFLVFFVIDNSEGI